MATVIWMRLRPAVGEADFGRQFTDRGVEIEKTRFDRSKHRQGREALRDGPDPEQVVRRYVDAGGDVRLADAAGPDRPVLLHQRDRRPGDTVLVENLLNLCREILDVDGHTRGIPIDPIRLLRRDRKRQHARTHQRDGTQSSHDASILNLPSDTSTSHGRTADPRRADHAQAIARANAFSLIPPLVVFDPARGVMHFPAAPGSAPFGVLAGAGRVDSGPHAIVHDQENR